MKKFLISFLCICMVLASVPMAGFAQTRNHNDAPQLSAQPVAPALASALPQVTPGKTRIRELTERRTSTARFYENSDGTFSVDVIAVDTTVATEEPNTSHYYRNYVKVGRDGNHLYRGLIKMEQFPSLKTGGDYIISSASLRLRHHLNHPTGKAQMTAYAITSPVNLRTVTWNNRNYSTSGAMGSGWVDGPGFYDIDVTKIVHDWNRHLNYGAGFGTANYGLELRGVETTLTPHKSFHSREAIDSYPTFTIEYAHPKRTITSKSNGANSSSGVINYSWSPVKNADHYTLGIWNGLYYEFYDVGKKTSYSSNSSALPAELKNIWPTPQEIAAKRHLLHRDGGGVRSLPDAPYPVYRNAPTTAYDNDSRYYFAVRYYDRSGTEMGIIFDCTVLPDATPPNPVPAVNASFNNATKQVNVSFSAATDAPEYNASGIKKYTIYYLPNGSSEYRYLGETTARSASYSLNSFANHNSFQIVVTAEDHNGNYSATTSAKRSSIVNVNRASGVSVTPQALTLNMGSTSQLTAKIAPANASDPRLTWASSNTTVATVDSNGRVTGKNPGRATITVKTNDGNKTATCQVTVIRPVSGVSLNANSKTIVRGNTFQLQATVSPSDATNKAVTWASSNSNVATVNSNGLVTAVSPGSATITVKTNEGNKTATCQITVTQPVTGVTLNSAAQTLVPQETFQLQATVLPANATNKAVTWASSDPNVATVDANGFVTAKSPGMAEITVKTTDGNKTQTCVITVKHPIVVQGINNTVTGHLNNQIDYSAGWVHKEYEPNAWNQDEHYTNTPGESFQVRFYGNQIKWLGATTSDLGKVEVFIDGQSKGIIDCYAPTRSDQVVLFDSGEIQTGQHTLKVVVLDGKNPASTNQYITVDKIEVFSPPTTPVQEISLDLEDTSINVGDTQQLSARILPAEASAKDVLWSSGDTSIATVDENGLITGVEAGQVTVTATTLDGGFRANCTVTVIRPHIPVTGVYLNTGMQIMRKDGTFQLVATVLPENASNQNVTWRSGNPEIATVDDNGLVSAVNSGFTFILVATEEGGYSAACMIAVVVPVDGVSLNETEKILEIDQTFQLIATLSPAGATTQDVSWSSSDESIVSVDAGGLITAVAPGEATITVTTQDGGFTASCRVTVPQPVTSVRLNETSQSIPVAGTFQLTATVLPENASNKAVSWSSSDASIATVDENGLITGIKAGQATITVTTQDGGHTASCQITVYNVPVTGISLNTGFRQMSKGDSFQLIATLYPSNATNKKVRWSSSNPDVLTVDDNGLIQTVDTGMAFVVATTEDGGYTASCVVFVIQPVTGVTLNETEKQLEPEQTFQLRAEVQPADAPNQSVTWESSHPDILSVDQTGLVTAHRAGEAVVTVTTVEGGFTAQCVFHVAESTIPVTGVTLNETSITLLENHSTQLIATILPQNATNQTVTWSSSDPSVATVDENGQVTGLAQGQAVITVLTQDGGHSASCSVDVLFVDVMAINLNDTVIGMGRNQIHYLGNWVYHKTNENAYQNDETYTNTPDDSFEMKFHGSYIQWFGSVGPDYGIADIYLDGVQLVDPIDCYNAERSDQRLLFDSGYLPDGEHTLKVVLRPDRNPAATGNHIAVDKIQIIGRP